MFKLHRIFLGIMLFPLTASALSEGVQEGTWPYTAQAGSQPPVCLVANLGTTCGTATEGFIATVTDALTASNCATGGGSTVGLVQYETGVGWRCTTAGAGGVQSPLTGNLPTGGYKLTGLGAGITSGDSIEFDQGIKSGDTCTGDLSGTFPACAVVNDSHTHDATNITGVITDAQISPTLSASIFLGSGSTTNAIDLATAEVAGLLGEANIDAAMARDSEITPLASGAGDPTTNNPACPAIGAMYLNTTSAALFNCISTATDQWYQVGSPNATTTTMGKITLAGDFSSASTAAVPRIGSMNPDNGNAEISINTGTDTISFDPAGDATPAMTLTESLLTVPGLATSNSDGVAPGNYIDLTPNEAGVGGTFGCAANTATPAHYRITDSKTASGTRLWEECDGTTVVGVRNLSPFHKTFAVNDFTHANLDGRCLPTWPGSATATPLENCMSGLTTYVNLGPLKQASATVFIHKLVCSFRATGGGSDSGDNMVVEVWESILAATPSTLGTSISFNNTELLLAQPKEVVINSYTSANVELIGVRVNSSSSDANGTAMTGINGVCELYGSM